MNASEIKVGSTVKLISGSPKLTVATLRAGKADLVWSNEGQLSLMKAVPVGALVCLDSEIEEKLKVWQRQMESIASENRELRQEKERLEKELAGLRKGPATCTLGDAVKHARTILHTSDWTDAVLYIGRALEVAGSYCPDCRYVNLERESDIIPIPLQAVVCLMKYLRTNEAGGNPELAQQYREEADNLIKSK